MRKSINHVSSQAFVENVDFSGKIEALNIL